MKIKIIIAGLILALLIPVVSSASGSLISGGAGSITADSWVSFTVNLGELSEEITSGTYNVSVSVSPAPSDFIVNEGVGSINAVSGSYSVNSADLDGITKLHFKTAPDSGITEATSYTVTVEVSGTGGSDSDSFSFTAVPVSSSGGDEQDDKGKQNGQNGKGQGNMPNKGNMSAQSGKANASGGNAASSGSGTSADSDKVTYQGSDNNYLKMLKVNGYKFTQSFNKTNDTYFITVPYDVSSLDVTATPEDSDAAAAVAGNSDLSSDTGRSKIVISVTAENGDIRTYRIYVDRQNDTED